MNRRHFLRNGLWVTGAAIGFPAIVRAQVIPSARRAVARTVAASASFTPTDISGLQLWLKADSLSLNDGDRVSTWNDSGSAGHNATAETDYRPVYKTNQIGGKPAVQFIRVSEYYMTANDVATHITGADHAYTCAAVVKAASSTSLRIYASFGNSAGTTSYVVMALSATDDYANRRKDDDFSEIVVSGGSTDTNAHYIVHNFAGTTLTQRVDGGAVNTDAAQNCGAMTNDTCGIGCLRGNNAYNCFDGVIAEVLIYDSSLSAGNVTSIETYLADKYGL